MPANRSSGSEEIVYVGGPHLSRADLDEVMAHLGERYDHVSVASGGRVYKSLDELRAAVSDGPEALTLKAESEGDGWLNVTVGRTEAFTHGVGTKRVREDAVHLAERLEARVPWYGQQATTPRTRTLQASLMVVMGLGIWHVLEQQGSEWTEAVVFLVALTFVNLNIWGTTLLGRTRIDLEP